MKISASIEIETRTRDAMTIEWVGILLTAPGMTDVQLNQPGMGDTKGAVHKAVEDAFSYFSAVNGLKGDEMTSQYSRHGLPGGIAAR